MVEGVGVAAVIDEVARDDQEENGQHPRECLLGAVGNSLRRELASPRRRSVCIPRGAFLLPWRWRRGIGRQQSWLGETRARLLYRSISCAAHPSRAARSAAGEPGRQDSPRGPRPFWVPFREKGGRRRRADPRPSTEGARDRRRRDEREAVRGRDTRRAYSRSNSSTGRRRPTAIERP